MYISTIASRILQSLEFFRSGFGKWLLLLWAKIVAFKWLAVPLFVWGIIKISISAFRLFCSAMRGYLDSVGFNGIQVGGANVLAIANTVLPLDELAGFIVAWCGLYSVCASIRFIRAAWSAIPLKAS